MAQNQFVNVTIDPSAAKKPDAANHIHVAGQAGSASSNMTISIDSAVVTSLTLLDSMYAAARKIYAGQLSR